MPKLNLLYISLNPIQNVKPYRLLEQNGAINLMVAYLEKPDASNFPGKENINKSAFDNDLLSGYNHAFIPNKQRLGKTKAFFNYGSTAIWQYVKKADIVVIYGHNFLTYWIAMAAAKFYGTKIILTTDATYIEANDESGGWKMKLKPFILKFLYNSWACAVFVPSTASKLFLIAQGIKEKNIVVTPYVVDEDLIEQIATNTDIASLRHHLNIPITDTVFVFCAKFIDRKRPLDAIEAFAKINNKNASLIMIGAGPLLQQLQQRTNELGLETKIIFPGIVKYSELASYYTGSDVLVFCSDHEPYGLPVNEAMICGIPVIVSDRIGARLDLVDEGITGWIYPSANVESLAATMQKAIDTKDNLLQMGKAAQEKMTHWNSSENVNRQLDFFKLKGWMPN